MAKNSGKGAYRRAVSGQQHVTSLLAPAQPDDGMNKSHPGGLNMCKSKIVDINDSATEFRPGRYVLIPEAATRIGLTERAIRGWREKCVFDVEMAKLFAKAGKFVFFDLDAWARYLDREQQKGVEAARAWQNRFRVVPLLQVTMAAALATLLLQGAGRF